ncbi:hypothetical protein LEP1GSC193_1466 [Leptospira alstonii serovar Pingchang str. 80-412]|uniref:Uncharacterized protein n=2 Tax=Leptospira alstonii TaxID=28452 RepID=M6CQE5_9LEPT|nr:hypothetical protein LEP1GSC194_1504 [Leptospira alstonii serovar Sichuan str. 79601]EQA81817.1 hypothetical protein LEP1GSC193_1466 [Leptospira alstonii serovar Pingchang str. 80-412]
MIFKNPPIAANKQYIRKKRAGDSRSFSFQRKNNIVLQR